MSRASSFSLSEEELAILKKKKEDTFVAIDPIDEKRRTNYPRPRDIARESGMNHIIGGGRRCRAKGCSHRAV